MFSSAAFTSARSTRVVMFSFLAIGSLVATPFLAAENPHDIQPIVLTNPEVSYGAGATSITVHGMRKGQADGPKDDKPLRQLQNSAKGKPGGGGGGGSSDGALQSSAFTSSGSISKLRNFEGLGNGFPNFSVNSAPPDTNGAVGATQFVQWVNESFAVFDKATGNTVAGPIAGNQLYQALGSTHPCAVNNDGDPIAQYDKVNNRWILTQFSVTNGSSVGYWQCIAISQTSDATGAYNVYAFRQPNFNDYPKFGVFNGTYFATYNMFKGNTFAGGRLCAYDAAAMRSGAAASEQCFQLSSAYGGVLPADVDGSTAPPTGANEYFLAFGSNSLLTWRFHVDFANSGNTSLTGPFTTSVATFSEACGGGTCIPQPSTTQQLDSLGDRLMYRLSYRHFADGHESLFVNHSVAATSTYTGARWYELRPSGNGTAGVTVYQQSTYGPAGGLSRWMGSIAADKNGDIVLGYSTSSSSSDPSISYSYRIPTDSFTGLGSEQVLFTGHGAQQRSLNRWGDYSAMTVDPVDDCTFWYTNEYLAANGTFNWHTRIASFKLNGCH
ncbi:MAG TPA: hypothetical protein VHU44_10475 [Acidobacteriaceae bacterium]|jgi:hypothetical protein|nr:hypothetical protein [Acidobacteriaceae bacterium]